MTNAWSLAASILNGTFDEDYPIMKKKEVEHSDYYYDYNRNDPDRENPFTDPVDRARAEVVIKTPQEHQRDLDWIEKSGGYEWTPGSPWPPSEFSIEEEDYYNTKMNYEPQRNHQYKYHEEEILKDIEEYVSSTYQGHYLSLIHI